MYTRRLPAEGWCKLESSRLPLMQAEKVGEFVEEQTASLRAQLSDHEKAVRRWASRSQQSLVDDGAALKKATTHLADEFLGLEKFVNLNYLVTLTQAVLPTSQDNRNPTAERRSLGNRFLQVCICKYCHGHY
jgi:hypothetical protein